MDAEVTYEQKIVTSGKKMSTKNFVTSAKIEDFVIQKHDKIGKKICHK